MELPKCSQPQDLLVCNYINLIPLQTKGNLTKHMKSKVHQRKCYEMGIVPVPMTVDESQLDADVLAQQFHDGKVGK